MKFIRLRMIRKNLHNRLEELEASRQDQYGSFEENMQRIASSWSILLDKHLIAPIEGWQVPLLYAQAKLIRSTHKFKEDSYDDALAYIVQAHDMHKKSEEDDLSSVETKPGT
jgi:hypothetical protein